MSNKGAILSEAILNSWIEEVRSCAKYPAAFEVMEDDLRGIILDICDSVLQQGRITDDLEVQFDVCFDSVSAFLPDNEKYLSRLRLLFVRMRVHILMHLEDYVETVEDTILLLDSAMDATNGSREFFTFLTFLKKELRYLVLALKLYTDQFDDPEAFLIDYLTSKYEESRVKSRLTKDEFNFWLVAFLCRVRPFFATIH